MDIEQLRRNLLLNALPDDSLAAVAKSVKTKELKLEDRLFAPEESVHVYFPLDAVISLIRNLSDGDALEVYMAGPEGMVGVNHVLGVKHNPHEGLVQSRGLAAIMSPDALQRLMEDDPAVRQVLLKFAYTMTAHASQLACCNRLHTVEQRLAHWLLLMHDRIGADEMSLTQEFLARMLSTRRAGINQAVQALELAGTITHRRSRVRIMDRAKLERASCECYHTMCDEYQRALGFAPVAEGRERPID
jgi:CRP-like cAMP-binding protein